MGFVSSGSDIMACVTRGGDYTARAHGAVGRYNPRNRAHGYAAFNRSTNPVHDVAEAVMGCDAWDAYKNSEYKSMKGPRRPHGSAAVDRHVVARKKKLGGTLAGWYL